MLRDRRSRRGGLNGAWRRPGGNLRFGRDLRVGPRRSGRRCRGGRRRWRCRRCRRGCRARDLDGIRQAREEQQRVDVPVGILRTPDAEMDVRDVVLELSTRADRPHGVAFCHRGAALDAHRAEMGQRDRVTVGSLNRHAFAANRHGSDKGNLAGHRRRDRRSGRCPDVDAAMLTSGVGVVPHGELL
jgi:hypothetical protein